MIHNIWVADSKPGPRYEKHFFGGLRLTKQVFHPGMWQTMAYPADVPYADLASRHIQLGGRMVDEAGRLPLREAGWISTMDLTVVPAGEHKRIALDTVELWCVHDEDALNLEKDAGHCHGVTRSAGESLVLQPGEHLLLIQGTVTARGKTFSALQHLVARTGPVELIFQDLGYGFWWPERLPG